MKQIIATVHVNAVSPEREEEFNNWYTYVHLRDVLNMPEAAIAAQRFELSEYQPKGFNSDYKFLTIYEVRNKYAFTEEHMKRVMSWEMYISPSMDMSDYKESYWDHSYGSISYASYADHSKADTVMNVLIAPKEGVTAEGIFTEEVIDRLGVMDGINAANLYTFGIDQMPKKTAAKEPNTHQIIIQMNDARRGIASWEKLVKELDTAGIEMAVSCYTPIMPRITEAYGTYQDRAIAELTHRLTAMPGYYIGGSYVKRTEILTPAIKTILDAEGK